MLIDKSKTIKTLKNPDKVLKLDVRATENNLWENILHLSISISDIYRILIVSEKKKELVKINLKIFVSQAKVFYHKMTHQVFISLWMLLNTDLLMFYTPKL